MKTSEFNYYLPKELIAQKPMSPRDHSRLLVLDRNSGKIEHRYFYEIVKFLWKGDILVLNDSRVIPARLLGKKVSTGGKAEVLLLRPKTDDLKKYVWSDTWLVIGKPELNQGQEIKFAGDLKGEILKVLNYQRIIKFNQKGERLRKTIYKIGQAPVPPYIQSKIANSRLRKYYQTVYAEKIGSVAAPTAGFHFTRRLMKKLKKQGVQFEFITLHVGLGTFQPVKTENIENHRLELEWAEIDRKTAQDLNQAKRQNRRIIAVGTTTTRTLEGFTDKKGILRTGRKFVDLFIYPGYKFKYVDALLTNFHLPKSTLLMLVSAFVPPTQKFRRASKASADKSALAGKNLIFKAYQEAIQKKYRFFSFGDAMFIK